MNKDDNSIVLYQAPDGSSFLQVHLDHDTVWLTQKQMAVLFGKDVRTVNEHVRNIFKEGELDEAPVIRKFRITAADGGHFPSWFRPYIRNGLTKPGGNVNCAKIS